MKGWWCDGCGDYRNHDGKESFSVEQRRLQEEVVQLRAALAGLISTIHVATQRGWHHMQIGHVQEAADEAQSVLPPL